MGEGVDWSAGWGKAGIWAWEVELRLLSLCGLGLGLGLGLGMVLELARFEAGFWDSTRVLEEDSTEGFKSGLKIKSLLSKFLIRFSSSLVRIGSCWLKSMDLWTACWGFLSSLLLYSCASFATFISLFLYLPSD